MTQVQWAGPLFYPPIGMIAVMDSGSRIEVWHGESESEGCFTGLLLKDDDFSCMWSRQFIDHIEPPTEDDRRLGWLPREDAAQ